MIHGRFWLITEENWWSGLELSVAVGVLVDEVGVGVEV